LGGYRVQGREPEQAQAVIDGAQQLEQAGADILVLECVPASLGKAVTEAVDIPVIGIGAGANCDGQVLVLYDMLGITPEPTPKFNHDFLKGTDSVLAAVTNYVTAVKSGEFPAVEQQY
jgi:3-methyl-2-oxobutanoate hydroxymethyltransferase